MVYQMGQDFIKVGVKRYAGFGLCVCLALAPVTASASAVSESNVTKTPHQAAVAMPDAYSADVAKQVLQSGGHAVDAAIAAAFVLAVTYPEAGNLGGGGFMTLYQNKQPYFLDYREMAPQAAFRDVYLNAEKKVIPHRSLVGYQASGVPGTVAGFWALHQRWGTRPWADLLAPAISLAKNGFIVSPELEKTARWYQTWIAKKSKTPLNFKAYFGDLRTGSLKKQPELAATLARLAKNGQNEFYHGQTARLLANQMQKNEGLITLTDLKNYEVKWRNPVQSPWQGYQLISAAPPSSGGIAIAQLLTMKSLLTPMFNHYVKNEGLSHEEQATLKIHFYAEIEKRVYADRAEYLGDPDFTNVPLAELISQGYLKKRIAGILFDEISHSETMKPGKIESAETTHFSILDAQGNAVSNTYTLNMPFGSGVVIEGAGFLMNDEMDDFSTKPGVANVFGVVGGKANEIAPRKRMLSSMSPTILLKDDQVSMVVGTPGGSSIITSVFQTIINVVEDKLTAQQAVDRVRVHHQLLPKNVIYFNPALSKDAKETLELMGYTLKRNDYLGDVQLIVNQNGNLSAASDQRGRGQSSTFSVPNPR